jgi:hypothetical protein
MEAPMLRNLKVTLLALCLLASLPALARADNAFEWRSDGWHAPGKPAAAVLDYSIDWTQWLAGDTLASSSWTCDPGITGTPVGLSTGATRTTLWLSGGTAGQSYNIADTVTTTAGRTQVVRFKIYVY